MSPKKFLTAAEILEIYGIDEETIRSLVEAHELKALADRGTWKYRRDEIESLISSGRLHSSHELPAVDDVDFDESMGFGNDVAEDQADFLELDEDALSGQSTVISSGPLPGTSDLHLTFDEEPAQSSSEVRIYEPADAIGSDSDIVIREPEDAKSEASEGSSSDVTIVPQEFGAGADSGSDVTVFEGEAASEQTFTEELNVVSDDETLESEESNVEDGTASDVTTTISDAFIDDNSQTEVFDPKQFDFEATAATKEQTAANLTEDVALDEDGLVLPDDSGLSLDLGDSGLSLASVTDDDSFESDAEDSGLRLDAGEESGIRLDLPEDSGLTLDAGDSGLSLELEDENDILGFADETFTPEPVAASDALTEELAFDDDGDESPATAFEIEDDESYPATFSEAIEAGDAVEDLEITDDLAAAAILDADEDVLEADDEFVDEEILEAEDDAFSDEFSGEMDAEDDDDSYLAPAAKAVPREPKWGVFPSLLVIGAAVIVGVNGWLMWEGLATMWTGATPSGPAASLISSIASMFG